jgi:hypothetical protein
MLWNYSVVNLAGELGAAARDALMGKTPPQQRWELTPRHTAQRGRVIL